MTKRSWFSVNDKVVGNRFSDFKDRKGLVVETWTDGPSAEFPQATVMWDDDGTDEIVPFEMLEYLEEHAR